MTLNTVNSCLADTRPVGRWDDAMGALVQLFRLANDDLTHLPGLIKDLKFLFSNWLLTGVNNGLLPITRGGS